MKDKTFEINNRRYLGNKYKLNTFIQEIIDKECGDFESFADLFAGTGVVAFLYQNKKLIVNDILYSNYVCHQTWFGNEDFDVTKIHRFIDKYNSHAEKKENYFSENFSNTYFSDSICKKIGFIREDIDNAYEEKLINEREKYILITSLLYAMDKIANTCGHYDAFRKNSKYNDKLILLFPKISKNSKYNEIYNLDATKLSQYVRADIVYLDPPYNSRQYCDSYHLLENVARWEKPDVVGVAKKMDRSHLKSDFCTTKAAKIFDNLIKSINAKYILLSYNNMGNKGDGRSQAKISDDDILKTLKEKGHVKVFKRRYKAFTTGKSDIDDNEERLFLCKCRLDCTVTINEKVFKVENKTFDIPEDLGYDTRY